MLLYVLEEVLTLIRVYFLPARDGHFYFGGRDAGVKRVEVPDGCHLRPGQTFTAVSSSFRSAAFTGPEAQLRAEKRPLSSLQLWTERWNTDTPDRFSAHSPGTHQVRALLSDWHELKARAARCALPKPRPLRLSSILWE